MLNVVKAVFLIFLESAQFCYEGSGLDLQGVPIKVKYFQFERGMG